MDHAVSMYRVRYRLMKWWYPFYSFMLNVSVNNAWKLYMKTTGNKVRMLDFLRGVVIQLISVHGSDKIPRQLSDPPNKLDGKDHWPAFNPAPPGSKLPQGKHHQKNCVYCYKHGRKNFKSTMCCSKCNVALHLPECFTVCSQFIFFLVICTPDNLFTKHLRNF